MKTKYILSSLLMSFMLVACSDDLDYTVETDPIMSQEDVVTGSSDVTATTAVLHATITGLENSNPNSYSVGFNYGTSQDNLNQSVNGVLNGTDLTAELTGLTDGATYYYQAFVVLQKRVTYLGAINALVTTDTKIETLEAQNVNAKGAVLSYNVTGAPADATYGIVISASSDTETLRAGLVVPEKAGASSVSVAGLAPNTVYYYAGYANIGPAVVYGDAKTFKTSDYQFDIDNDLVDLGLSTKWAKYNVGASSESELGGLFGYGDCSGVSNSISPNDYANADIYKTDRDMANVAWGGKVTLPTAAEFEELFNSCSKEWTSVDGVEGYKLTGPNGNHIFLPAAGSRTLNDVNSAGAEGRYATGSINSGDPRFSVSYRFANNGSSRASTPVYEALSVRPVSTAKNVPFNKEYLCKTWEIDYNDGASLMFNGPVWFYGTDDSWRTVSNKEPVVGNSWSWEADATNTWAFGDCTGSMTFDADGNITVKYADGSEQKGTYTLDVNNKTITSTIDMLVPTAYDSSAVQNRKNAIKILALSEDKVQFGYFRDSDPATISVNMIPANKKYGFSINLLCVGSDWGGTWGTELACLTDTELDGVHTLHYDGACPGAMVFAIDAAGLRNAYPNCVMAIRDIRCDGESIKFDSNKFFYGDIENNGNFRVELFNIWGKGAADNKVKESPFSAATNCDSEPAFHFSSNVEFDVAIIRNPTFTPMLITINPSWGGSWDYNQGATFDIVVDENSKLAFSKSSFDITLESDIYSEGSIMTFTQVNDLHKYFPQTHSVLDALYLDGNLVQGYDASKIVDTSDGDAYRLELWNMYGSTSANGCAFGTPAENGAISGLGFNKSMRMQFTFKSLFNKVEW